MDLVSRRYEICLLLGLEGLKASFGLGSGNWYVPLSNHPSPATYVHSLPAVYEIGASEIGVSGKRWTIPVAGQGVDASRSLLGLDDVDRYPAGG